MDKSVCSVSQIEDGGHPVIVLRDQAGRSRAWVTSDLGLNAYRFSVQHEGHEFEIFDRPPTLDHLREHPAYYGMPILFPFPGAVAQSRFSFDNREYVLKGSGSHGFVLSRPWQVTAVSATPEGAVLSGRFSSRAFPELAEEYPSAFRLDVTYRLRAWTLTIEARTENVGSDLLPAGYGLHPYLCAPIGSGGGAGTCTIQVPVTSCWELVDLMPTGRILPLGQDLASGVPLEGRSFDDAYTGIPATGAGSRCVLTDTEAALSVTVEADQQFREWVVYTPPRSAISFEPHTCVPDALNLQNRGIDAGLIILKPGECRTWSVRVAVRPL